MTRSVEFDPAARAETEAAFEWYLERSRRAAADFVAELGRALDRIAQAPQTFARVDGDTRRAVLRHFPYLVVFRETASRIEIIAVAHGRRKPGYWRGRL